jgi:N-acetylmuramoyl-L-alanine amidase
MQGCLKWAERGLLFMILATVVALAYFASQGMGTLAPTPVPTATATSIFLTHHPNPRPADLPPQKIGIIPGHWENDSGAVCDDGLTEAEITLSVAKKVRDLLEWYGYDVELLPEYSPRIAGYVADAFVAIHADSCLLQEGTTGFKVARVQNSAIPTLDDHLAQCLWTEYEAATHLSRHEGSITADMLHYHALKDIAAQTPGAIIEIGFLGKDRETLVFRQDIVAQGIANALICFLEGS